MLRANELAKRKTTESDAGKIADCLRCTFSPDDTWLPPRSGNGGARSVSDLLVRQAVQLKIDYRAAAGNRRELQHAEAAQGGLLSDCWKTQEIYRTTAATAETVPGES